VSGQLFLEISILLADNRKSAIVYVEWYQWSRLIAFLDPLANPLLAIVRTPALRRMARKDVRYLLKCYRRMSNYCSCFSKSKYTTVRAAHQTVSSHVDARSEP
jgi:hypothetical protein